MTRARRAALAAGAERLWEKATERSERALAMGALSPIETAEEVVEDGGVPFAVRVIASLARKDKTRGGARNPFLPPEPDLVVTEVGDSHLVVLNKFNVVPVHLLLVTRAFEDQAELLTEADFEALWACMAERDAFAFYNGGESAGASQRHRHLQLVPVPLGRGPERVPVERALDRLPFPHALADTPATARRAREVYLDLLRAVGRGHAGAAYNLLVTRGWMMAVPRTRTRFDGISVNALGFAGSFLAKDRAQLETIRAAGPMRILREVC